MPVDLFSVSVRTSFMYWPKGVGALSAVRRGVRWGRRGCGGGAAGSGIGVGRGRRMWRGLWGWGVAAELAAARWRMGRSGAGGEVAG